METPSGMESLIGRRVVLDTAGPITCLGTLREICADGFWLDAADIRDRTEGHIPKEWYVCEARHHGIRPNRARIFVLAAVISCSALDDVVAE